MSLAPRGLRVNRKSGPCLTALLLLAASVLGLGSFEMESPQAIPETPTGDEDSDPLASLPGWFTENRGQVADESVRFTFSGGGVAFLESAVLLEAGEGAQRSLVKVTFPGANPVAPEGERELAHRSNYFLGSDPEAWRSGVPNYEQVVYRDLYPGLDLIYYSAAEGLKYDWVAKPGADPEIIRERFEGADSVSLDQNGGLVITTPAGEMRENKPYSYQIINGKSVKVGVSFRLMEDRSLVYELGNYEATEDLIIDPLIYSTFVGGSNWDAGENIVLDSENNAYVTGRTSSSDFPTTSGSFDDSHNGDEDVFVFKLNTDGSDLIYSTFIGGSSDEIGYDIALDFENNAYVTGGTSSSDFPTTSGSFDDTYNGGAEIRKGDVFVSKLNSDGSDLVYSTFVGGRDDDYGLGIELDSENNAYVTGTTFSPNFPTTSGSYDYLYNGNADVFALKLNSDGSDLVYSTFIGGSYTDYGFTIILDSENNAYLTSNTGSPDFPTTPGSYDESHNGGMDVYVLKLNSDGSDLVYSTFVGESDSDHGNGIALDSENNAYVVGKTRSTDFPTTSGSFDDSHNGDWDVYVFKLNSDGSDLVYSTFIGGSDLDWATQAIALDSENNVYATGFTASSDFPTTSGSFDESHNGGRDVYVFKLNSDGSDLLYSTFVGGGISSDRGYGIALDSENNAYVTGHTRSPDFPTTSGSYDDSHNGHYDVFVFKLNLGEPTAIDGPEDDGGDDDVGPLGLSTTTWLLIGASVALAGVGGGVLVWRRSRAEEEWDEW